MPKHRQAGYAVIREMAVKIDGREPRWVYNGLVGVYLSLQRAEEVAATTVQIYLDMGMDPENPDYRCTPNPTNWYDE